MNSRSSCRVFRASLGRVICPVEAGVKETIWGSTAADFVPCLLMTVVPPLFPNPMMPSGRGPPSTFNAQRDNPDRSIGGGFGDVCSRDCGKDCHCSGSSRRRQYDCKSPEAGSRPQPSASNLCVALHAGGMVSSAACQCMFEYDDSDDKGS